MKTGSIHRYYYYSCHLVLFESCGEWIKVRHQKVPFYTGTMVSYTLLQEIGSIKSVYKYAKQKQLNLQVKRKLTFHDHSTR